MKCLYQLGIWFFSPIERKIPRDFRVCYLEEQEEPDDIGLLSLMDDACAVIGISLPGM